MPFVCGCVCGAPKPRKKMTTNQKAAMDFRRADPMYVNFVPRTCVDAIDLFNRHRNLGLTADLYPECFVHCARQLPGPELDMFHRFIVTPSGDIEKGGETPSPIDAQLENERQLLLKESEARDRPMSISEEPMSQDDEKCPMSMSDDATESADYIKIISAT